MIIPLSESPTKLYEIDFYAIPLHQKDRLSMSIQETRSQLTFRPNYPHPERALLSTPHRINAPTEYLGRGVVIAYVDSGFYMHPDIARRVLVHVDATTAQVMEEPRVTKSDVMSWHGLMTSTIGSGDGSASNSQYRSAAPESRLVLIKVSNPRFGVKENDILRGFAWLLRNHERFGIRVVNASVGGDYVSNNRNHPLHRAIRELVRANITVVAAAGNSGMQQLVPPASAPEAIVVGGYNDNNSLNRREWTGYNNNYGRSYTGTIKPDVIAPANWIAAPILPETHVDQEAQWLGTLLQPDSENAFRALIDNGLDDLNLTKPAQGKVDHVRTQLQERIHMYKLINRYYQHVDGTSVSTPIVTSVVAQMLEANPHLTPENIRKILRDTAVPVYGIPPERQGAGAINAKAAVETAQSWPRIFGLLRRLTS